MSDAVDFEEQLRQEEIEKAKAEGGARSYKDKDGVEYEWDAQKQAWFPKIDDDFIARYQMSYGCSTTEGEASSTADANKTQSVTPTSAAPTTFDAFYAEYSCKHHYTTAGTTGDCTTTTASNEASKPATSGQPGTSDTEEKQEYSQAYIDYCKDYYRYYHGELNEDEDFDYCQYYNYYSQYEKASDATEGTESSGEGQSSQGGDGEGEKGKEEDKKAEPKPGEKRKKDDGWFEMDQDRNTNIYVSGLPEDMTDDEFIELMSKYGMIMHDPLTRKPKIKLYKDEEGKVKGDGRCCYIKVESVNLALQLLDGSEYKGKRVHVEKANFQVKGDYNPKLRKKLSNRQKKKMKLQQQKLFDWRPDALPGERKKSDKIVVLKNVFNPKDFEKDPASIQEIRSDLRLECSKFGEVKKVTVYDRHPEGIATVSFKEPEEADVCIEALNGRWFDSRKLSAVTWDGRTKYDVKETEDEREERLKKWEKFLETGEAKDKPSEEKSQDEKNAKTEQTKDMKDSATVASDGEDAHQGKSSMEVDDGGAASS